MNLITTLVLSTLMTFSAFTNNVNTDPNNDGKDIVELAVNTDFLSTLVAAVKAGDLVGVLQGDGPFTVFAPTNDAFEH